MKLTKHPMNTGFDWQDRQGPFKLITDAQAAQYNNQGFFVLENVFSAEEIAAVEAAIDPLEQQTEAFLRTQADGKLFIAQADQITFTINCVLHNEVLKRFTQHNVFADLCHDLMGPDCRLYWDQAVYKKPEPEREFPWHQDNGYTFVSPQQYLTCWVALTDATEDNGCPWVVPNVHREGTYEHWMTDMGWRCVDDDEGSALCAPVKAGGIVVFSSLTPHRTGPNKTSGIRKAYIAQFAPDGAALIQPDGSSTMCDDPARQYHVVKDGAPVAA
ncbi:MAG: phytanoyl-CoA dioxygenase family protein [Alphaproteobacteria bacterium]